MIQKSVRDYLHGIPAISNNKYKNTKLTAVQLQKIITEEALALKALHSVITVKENHEKEIINARIKTKDKGF